MANYRLEWANKPEKGEEPQWNLWRMFLAADFPFGSLAGTVGFYWAYVSGRYDKVRVVSADADADFNAVWKARERARFDEDGLDTPAYKAVPWADTLEDKHPDHFVHMALDHPGKIAFTENDAKGLADRQTVIAPGRYLTRFYADTLTPQEIEAWAAAVSVLAGEFALKVTSDADEIEDVYVNGPSSCMAYNADDFSSSCHPARVYAGPDLAVAYIGPRDNPSGRSVVWPERKVFSTIYGDCSRLRMLLTEQGYKEGGLDGARVRRIRDGSAFVMPYVDGIDSASDTGEFIVLDDCGSLDCQNTHGLTGSRWICPSCGDAEDEDESTWVEDVEESWCVHCASNNTFHCEHSGETFSDNEDSVKVYRIHRIYRYNPATAGYGYVHEYQSMTIAERYLDQYDTVTDDEGDIIVREDIEGVIGPIVEFIQCFGPQLSLDLAA